MIPAILCALYVVYLYHKLNRDAAGNGDHPPTGASPEWLDSRQAAGKSEGEALISRLKALEERIGALDVSPQ